MIIYLIKLLIVRFAISFIKLPHGTRIRSNLVGGWAMPLTLKTYYQVIDLIIVLKIAEFRKPWKYKAATSYKSVYNKGLQIKIR